MCVFFSTSFSTNRTEFFVFFKPSVKSMRIPTMDKKGSLSFILGLICSQKDVSQIDKELFICQLFYILHPATTHIVWPDNSFCALCPISYFKFERFL